MGKLVLKLADGRTRDIPLDRERITIGRRADNDVCLPFPAVSGEHAAVVTILDDSFLEDLNSTNGTLVNGKSVAKHFLRDHDEIDIGRQVLIYVSGDGASIPTGAASASESKAKAWRVAAETSAHAKSRPQSGAAAGAGPGPAAMPSPGPHAEVPMPARAPDSSSRSGRRVNTTPLVREPPMATTPTGDADGSRPVASMATPTLEVVEGSGAGRVVRIDREVFVIGRVGLQVAAALRTPDGLRLVHVEGDTRPRINGAALPEEGSLLALGDEIEIAGARLRFHPGR
jgi:pSer/pThr/pTyr-binding forkhead associated (FHA) protein